MNIFKKFIGMFVDNAENRDLVVAAEAGDNDHLIEAAVAGDLKLVQELIKNGADVSARSSDGRNALMQASYEGHAKVVKILIEAGADVNGRDKHGRTALMKASTGGYLDIVELLLVAGADANAADNDGATALIDAVGSISVVKSLVAAGADVNVISKKKMMTALLKSSDKGYADTVKYLISSGADVNLKDDCGVTALTKASWNGNVEIVKALVGGGADADVKESLDAARKNGHKKICEILRSAYKDVFAKYIASDEVTGDCFGMPDLQSLAMAGQGLSETFTIWIRCGACDYAWEDAVRYKSWTVVKCPGCKKLNKVDSSHIGFYNYVG